MAMPRVPKKRITKVGTEYRFRIDAYTPDTIPMSRLAEYMAELSRLLGERNAVHFRRLLRGSCVLVQRIDREAVPKVRERMIRVRAGDAPTDATRAYNTINKFLRDDNAIGVLRDKEAHGVVVRFPGREEAEEKFPSVRQHGSLDGIVVRVGGTDETVPVWLEAEDRQISGCFTTRAIAKQLGAKLFEPVRLHGQGRWSRDSDGAWSLVNFKIESFDPLEETPLSSALEQLRAIPAEWGDSAYDELGLIRHGPKGKGKRNGGH
jgi:hypothetical protein